jgi:hypothetical protein
MHHPVPAALKRGASPMPRHEHLGIATGLLAPATLTRVSFAFLAGIVSFASHHFDTP